MKNTRQTQPYRKSGSRPPSPVLDRMLAGKQTATPGVGKPLVNAMRGPGKKSKRYLPRY